MKKYLLVALLVSFGLAQISVWASSDVDNYSVRSVIKIVEPYDIESMNNEFQVARILRTDGKVATVEIVYRNFKDQNVGQTRDWVGAHPELQRYIEPTPSENWDSAMQDDLLKQLALADIHRERLTDRQFVQRVARWSLQRADQINTFSIWATEFQGGRPRVSADLELHFHRNKAVASWDSNKVFETEVLGRGMYYNRVRGGCTSTAIYLATILRAAGVPTRFVVCIPPFDPNSLDQRNQFLSAVTNTPVRQSVIRATSAYSGFVNHIFNEVFIGGKWTRLNYDNLGGGIVNSSYLGLITHIATIRSISELGLSKTWGKRYFLYPNYGPRLSSVNPYQLISVTEILSQ